MYPMPRKASMLHRRIPRRWSPCSSVALQVQLWPIVVVSTCILVTDVPMGSYHSKATKDVDIVDVFELVRRNVGQLLGFKNTVVDHQAIYPSKGLDSQVDEFAWELLPIIRHLPIISSSFSTDQATEKTVPVTL